MILSTLANLRTGDLKKPHNLRHNRTLQSTTGNPPLNLSAQTPYQKQLPLPAQNPHQKQTNRLEHADGCTYKFS